MDSSGKEKKKKKKSWPTEERISDSEKGESFFFFPYFIRGRVDQRGISSIRGISVKLSSGSRYYTSVGESWKGIEGVKRKAKKDTGNGRMRCSTTESCTQGNGLIPKTFESPRFCSRRAQYTGSDVVVSPPMISKSRMDTEKKRGKEKIG